MADIGHQETDAIVARMERKVSGIYREAVADVQDKLDDYLRRFEIKDKIKRQQLANGIITRKEYNQWRTGQIMIGQRWEEMRDTLAQDLHNANAIARSAVNGYMPDVYALNHNYATFEVEKAGRVDTSYTLYDRKTVERLMEDDPQILPAPGRNMRSRIAAGKDIAWQEGKIQSVMLQSILQGESIPNMARRIARTMGETNHASTIRYARTASTAAQNAGRHDAYKRAEGMGIEMRQTWVATLDGRTRHEHRQLDGQTVGIDEPFKVDGYEIRYPGDPTAPAGLVWNCRCTTIAQFKGFERDVSDLGLRRDADLGGMSYEEWKEGHSQSEPITRQEDVSEGMKWRTINEDYRGNSSNGVDNSLADDIMRYRSEDRSRIGRSVEPMEKTVDMALDRPTYINAVVSKYRINLSGAGQAISVVVDDTIPQFGKVKKSDPTTIRLGLSAFESEQQLALTLAHELNHCRSYIRGGDAPEKTAYDAEDALLAFMRGER